MKKHIYIIIAAFTLLTILVLASACESQQNHQSASLQQLSEQSYPKIELQGDFPVKVVYGMPSVQSSPYKMMKVSVPIRLTTDKQLAVKYRYIFYDSANSRIEPVSDWRERTLFNNNTYLSGSTENPTASDWRLEIKPTDLTYAR
ncbi:hypothetical protein KS4_29340 [Poriferisphaera corsica]|uniref:DUF3859 domain-containing protein n=1 Tax=Poriferisphaera corsica TaxID=2528020 RepID=A0A517YXA9_9BACT|nr:DUF1425 domain-containing protein [Poriferisphaera corsica]QDU34858.1 hypothetical protein KS4_29340 [Poriferisphaera corsica]